MTGHVLCCPDKFRGALSAADAAGALAEGVRAGGFAAVEHPLADGGEGTLDAIVAATGARVVAAAGGRVAWMPGRRAVVELADVVGLAAGRLDVMRATTEPAGRLIAAALDGGAEEVVVALGGTATVDGGLGALRALGARLLDAHGRPLAGGPEELPRLAEVDLAGVDPRVAGRLVLAADVLAPLCGPDGAASMFGPQKGARPDEVEVLEAGLGQLARVVGWAPDAPGGGAAGGFAVPFLARLGARLESGAELIRRVTGFAAAARGAIACLTGEGRADRQSAHGKTVAGVLAASPVPVCIVAGAVDDGAATLLDAGAAGVFGVARGARPLVEALDATAADLRWFGRSFAALLREFRIAESHVAMQESHA